MNPTPKRLPLYALDPQVLADLHRSGQTYTEVSVPEAPTPVEEMTVEELAKTQYQDIESESRRCWLATGQGALTLAQHTDLDDEAGTLADVTAESHDAARYGVAYATVDPHIQRRIEWERAAAQSGPVTTIRLERGQMRLSRYVSREEFNHLRQTVLPLLFGVAPQARVWLTKDAFREAKKRSYQSLRSAERYARLMADDEWHTSTEVTHEGEIVGYRLHRDGAMGRDAFYRGQARDATELELGTHLMADAELEATLGAAV